MTEYAAKEERLLRVIDDQPIQYLDLVIKMLATAVSRGMTAEELIEALEQRAYLEEDDDVSDRV